MLNFDRRYLVHLILRIFLAYLIDKYNIFNITISMPYIEAF